LVAERFGNLKWQDLPHISALFVERDFPEETSNVLDVSFQKTVISFAAPIAAILTKNDPLRSTF